MRTLVTGATGFVGRRLVSKLHDVVVLSRNAAKARQSLKGSKIQAFDWIADSHPPAVEALDGVSVVFHLAGDPLPEGRWTAGKRRRIRDSRILGTRHLVDAIEKVKTGAKNGMNDVPVEVVKITKAYRKGAAATPSQGAAKTEGKG